MYRYAFAVGEEVYCCWEHDLPQKNERFLASIDGGYFNYIALTHLEHIEGEDKQRAAIVIRSAYHLGLETLFSLLGALCQAPAAVPAWIPKCSNMALREIVRTLSLGGSLLTQAGRQSLDLRQLADLVHQYCWPDEKPAGATGERFALLWRRFAQDLLDAHHIVEYNSIKHGFRVSSGGFTLRIGQEVEFGVPAPEASMQTVGSSPYGTRFLEVQPVVEDPAAKHHFRIRNMALNWRAEAMGQRLQLLAWSIQNVASALRCINGAPPNTVQFHRPEDPAAFEAAWNWNVGVFSSNSDYVIEPSDVEPVSRDVLRRELESRSRGGAE